MYKKTDWGCVHQGKSYSNGATVEAENPCLNCTCQNALLLCTLRVCPTLIPPQPGCIPTRNPKECCPSWICGKELKTTPAPDDTVELRPTFQPEMVTPMANDSTLFITSEMPDFGQDLQPNTSKGCIVNGTLYAEGSAMLSKAFCEYCFCIKGETRCLKPDCHLEIKGCTPRFENVYNCCPSSYDCGSHKTVYKGHIFPRINVFPETTTVTTTPSTIYDSDPEDIPPPTTISSLTNTTTPGKCVVDPMIFNIGDNVPNFLACQNCYCTESGVVCKVIECSNKLNGCEPIIPSDHCCPVSYRCPDDEDDHGTELNLIHGNNYPSISKMTVSKTAVTQSMDILKKGTNDSDMALSEELKLVFDNSFVVYGKNDQELPREKGNVIEIKTEVTTQSAEISVKRSDKNLNTSLNEALQQVDVNSHPVYEKNYKEELGVSNIPPREDLQFDDDEEISIMSVNTKEMLSLDNYTQETETTVVIRSESNLFSFSDNTDNEESAVTTPMNFFGVGEDETDEEGSILTGSPEVHTLEITDLLRQLLSQTANLSHFTTEMSFSGKRNNSKKPSSIMNEFPALGKNDSHNWSQENHTGEEETASRLPENKFESVEKITQEMANNEFVTKQPVQDLKQTTSLLTTLFPNIGNSFESTMRSMQDETSPYFNIIKMMQGNEAILPFKSSINEQRDVNPEERRTDVSTPAAEKPVSDSDPTEIKSLKFTTHSTSTKVNISSIKKEATKGPRIQDPHEKLSTAQGYDIIPFVAQDAMRGQHVKVNGSTVDSAGSDPDMISDFCFVNGRIYTKGELIITADPCDFCRCVYGRKICTKKDCPVPPGCQPEKVPGYCCPRFTCGNDMTPESQAKNVTMNSIPSPSLPTPYPRLPERIRPVIAVQEKTTLKYGSRVRPRPTQMYPESKSTARPTTRFSESSSITPKYGYSTERTNSFPHFVKEVATTEPDVAQSTRANSFDFVRSTYQASDFEISSSVRNADTSSKIAIKTTTQQAELQFVPDPWGLLKVSGCNIYGKFFKINDQVEILSGPCSHCICTTNGVECNDIC
ncbi:uncharacterized protein LOC129219099 [Uloborus diversus]|uniref:uncharacterized protein LOC129219099 n=1 Tax=Uloborus diversus TaxID=327109 RepID=UPI002409E3B4|nr:uncharacterized protein LOC129219099 [Uloborus diversus]